MEDTSRFLLDDTCPYTEMTKGTGTDPDGLYNFSKGYRLYMDKEKTNLTQMRMEYLSRSDSISVIAIDGRIGSGAAGGELL